MISADLADLIARRPLATLAILVALISAIYVASPVSTQTDSRFVLQTAHSFLHGNGGDLSAYEPALRRHDYYITDRIRGVRSYFPIGTALLAVPFVAAMELVDPALAARLADDVQHSFDKNLSALISAFAVGVFGLLIWVAFRRPGLLVAGVLVLAFATSMWSTSSRSLWQHGPLVMLLSAALALLVGAERRPALAALAALPLAAAFIVRPTSAIEIAAFGTWVLVRYPREFPKFAALGAAVALPWLAYNLYIFHKPLPPYFYPPRLRTPSFWVGFFGQVVSPSRGLLVFSPICLLAIPGFFASLRDPDRRGLHIAMAVAIVLHWIMLGRFPHWFGGHSYGPRLMTDVLPMVVYFIVYFWSASGGRRPALAAVTAVLVTISVAIHAAGALDQRTFAWNVSPANVDLQPARLWDWSDPQFLRTFTSRP